MVNVYCRVFENAMFDMYCAALTIGAVNGLLNSARCWRPSSIVVDWLFARWSGISIQRFGRIKYLQCHLELNSNKLVTQGLM